MNVLLNSELWWRFPMASVGLDFLKCEDMTPFCASPTGPTILFKLLVRFPIF